MQEKSKEQKIKESINLVLNKKTIKANKDYLWKDILYYFDGPILSWLNKKKHCGAGSRFESEFEDYLQIARMQIFIIITSGKVDFEQNWTQFLIISAKNKIRDWQKHKFLGEKPGNPMNLNDYIDFMNEKEIDRDIREGDYYD